MRRHSLLSLCLLFAACGGEVDDYPGAVPGDQRCGGSFARATRTQLGAVTTHGACANEISLDVVCETDLAATAAVCGQPCALQNLSDDAAIKSCTTRCMQQQLTLDPSEACLDCFSDSVVCTKQHCLAICSTDPSSGACTQCQAVNGCFTAFFTCTGLPAPQPADAGP